MIFTSLLSRARRAGAVAATVSLSVMHGAQAAPASKPSADVGTWHATPPPTAIYSNTSRVEGIVAKDQEVWVATRGGLERYGLSSHQRLGLYTTSDGLPSLTVEKLTIGPNGQLFVQTDRGGCVLKLAEARPRCSSLPPTAQESSVPPAAALGNTPSPKIVPPSTHVRSLGSWEGAPITARWVAPDGTEWFGTAGQGLWLRQRAYAKRLTPPGQVSGNHVVAMTEWKGRSYFATFEDGLSSYQGGSFTRAALGPRMLNDVIGTGAGLFVATSEGLYWSKDGETFRRDTRVREATTTDLAYDSNRETLYVAATNSLWTIPLRRSRRAIRAAYEPGGSRALQAVDVAPDGTVYLAAEDRGVLRQTSQRGFEVFDRLSGLPASWAIDVLAVDTSAALFGSLRSGVFPIGPSAAASLPVPHSWTLFLGRDTTAPGRVYVGTQGGAFALENGVGTQWSELPHPCVHAVARLSTGLWVGTEGGLARYR